MADVHPSTLNASPSSTRRSSTSTMVPELATPINEKEEALPASAPRRPSWWSRAHLCADVNPGAITYQMIAYCFMTGWLVEISAIFTWPGFQTGNTTTLAIALARATQNQPGAFGLVNGFALTSVLTFLFGSFLGRIGDRIGAKTRAWLILGTVIQALMTVSAGIAIWRSREDRDVVLKDDIWATVTAYVTLGLISASLGLQGIMGKRLGTQFATTIVFTVTWCELMAEPTLFHLRKLVKSRDHKIISIVALFVGAFVGRVVLQQVGSAATLGIGAALRGVIALSFLWVKGESC